MEKYKLGLVSLGCDKNRVDSEIMLGMLKNTYEITEEPRLTSPNLYFSIQFSLYPVRFHFLQRYYYIFNWKLCQEHHNTLKNLAHLSMGPYTLKVSYPFSQLIFSFI